MIFDFNTFLSLFVMSFLKLYFWIRLEFVGFYGFNFD